MSKEAETTETKTVVRKDKWEVSGIWIVRGSSDYKFYVSEEPTTNNYVGALRPSEMDDKKAEQWAIKIAVKKGLVS